MLRRLALSFTNLSDVIIIVCQQQFLFVSLKSLGPDEDWTFLSLRRRHIPVASLCDLKLNFRTKSLDYKALFHLNMTAEKLTCQSSNCIIIYVYVIIFPNSH